ncbi:hypothetical protein L596_014478 [Steinernema carpocapsae]|uniref:Uncharacterized protein n=1 Tax=Steinernema carpocapsae TaxID=34508 RepID=A0A4U5NC99_STECR|nr:hypothetical protein L596_014478 [Steinernema carpocapsae]
MQSINFLGSVFDPRRLSRPSNAFPRCFRLASELLAAIWPAGELRHAWLIDALQTVLPTTGSCNTPQILGF